MIYLDNAASTPVREGVLDAMLPYLRGEFGNPSSIHRRGRRARRAVERARGQVARLVGAEPSEVLFTSGGTESDSTAVLGACSGRPGPVVTSAIEHDAVLEPCRMLERGGRRVSYLPAGESGLVDPASLEEALTGDTALVSVMLANNEVGTIQPVRELARICRKRGVLFHTDAVQAAGKIPVDVKELGVDMLSISSHKINGPKGAGALYVRAGTDLDPVLLGGGQEGGMRSGTENVAGIAGFGAACELAREGLGADSARVRAMRDGLVRRVTGAIPHATVNGDPGSMLPGTAHFTFLGVNGEDLIIKLDEHGVAASTGSACSVHTQKESHVLRAMGMSREQITGSLRLTVGVMNTEEEMEEAAGILGRVVSELRAVSPFREKYSF